jgi:transcriptional regulator with XRE-family HTH domain
MNRSHYDHERLRDLRLRRHLTQEQVARALDVQRQTIYRAEKGYRISFNVLLQLAKFYGVNHLTLMRRAPLKTPEAA